MSAINSWLRQFTHVLKPPDLNFRNFRDDFWGGLTAAIVALPLALAFGVSSGAGAVTGLYGAIFVIDWSFLRRAHRLSLKATGLMYGVLFLKVFVDLITAVAVGVFFANLLTVKSLSDLQSKRVRAIIHPTDEALAPEEQTLLEAGQGRIMLFQLSGPMSFGAA